MTQATRRMYSLVTPEAMTEDVAHCCCSSCRGDQCDHDCTCGSNCNCSHCECGDNRSSL